MRALLLALALFGASLPASAIDVVIRWTNATTNVDGSAIPATGPNALLNTTAEWGTCGTGGTFGTLIGSQTVAIPATETASFALPDGNYCFRARHANNGGAVSAYSAIVQRALVTLQTPRGPVIVEIRAN